MNYGFVKKESHHKLESLLGNSEVYDSIITSMFRFDDGDHNIRIGLDDGYWWEVEFGDTSLEHVTLRTLEVFRIHDVNICTSKCKKEIKILFDLDQL